MENDETRKWVVNIRRKVNKNLSKMPQREQRAFADLLDDLAEKGPIRKEWPNFRCIMQVVVKTPPIRLEGEIPENLVEYLKKEFGDINVVQDDGGDDDELINVFETEWYKNIKKEIKPRETIRFYREMHGFTQAELGMKIGRFSRQYISNLENGHRPISKAVAKRLSEVFEISVARFI